MVLFASFSITVGLFVLLYGPWVLFRYLQYRQDCLAHEVCEIHHVKMELETIQGCVGTTYYYDPSFYIMCAGLEKRFPHGYQKARWSSDEKPSETKEIFVCFRCAAQFEQWQKESEKQRHLRHYYTWLKAWQAAGYPWPFKPQLSEKTAPTNAP
jgi:hypothetical protein